MMATRTVFFFWGLNAVFFMAGLAEAVGVSDGAQNGVDAARKGVDNAVATYTDSLERDGILEKKIEDLEKLKARILAAIEEATPDGQQQALHDKLNGIVQEIAKLHNDRHRPDGTIDRKMKALEQVAANKKSFDSLKEVQNQLTYEDQNTGHENIVGGTGNKGPELLGGRYDLSNRNDSVPILDANGKHTGAYLGGDGRIYFNSSGDGYNTSNWRYLDGFTNGTAGTAEHMKGLTHFGPNNEAHVWSGGGVLNDGGPPHWQHLFSGENGKPATVWDNGAGSRTQTPAARTVTYDAREHSQFSELGSGFKSFSTASDGPIRQHGQIALPRQITPASIFDPASGQIFERPDPQYPFLLTPQGNALPIEYPSGNGQILKLDRNAAALPAPSNQILDFNNPATPPGPR